MSKRLVGITEKDANRIGKATRSVERVPKATVGRPQPTTSTCYAWVVRTTEVIPKASDSTPGKGSAKLQGFNGTSFFDLDSPPVALLNMTDARIKSGAYVPASPGYGCFLYMPTSCSNEAN